MGYLTCRAESAIATSNSHNHRQRRHQQQQQQQQKPSSIQHFEYSDLEAATNGFSDRKLLGKGSHGRVYKAVLRGGRQVAVKKPSRAATGTATATSVLSEVDNEISILSSLHSPRLVNLVGFTADSDSKGRLLVVELMSNGTLYDVLHSNPSPPNWGRRIRFALQTAKAIQTLHSSVPPVIHRDIKSANVLIDRDFNARLGDFGLALRCHADDHRRLRSTPPAGTIGYLDPWYVTPDGVSPKTDVFSFGILLLEIISGRKAMDAGHSPPSIVEWAIPLIKKGKVSAVFDPRLVPPKDLLVRRQLGLIVTKCVRPCRERRPPMEDVVHWLAALAKAVPRADSNRFNSARFSINPCLMVAEDVVGTPALELGSCASSRLNDVDLEGGGGGGNVGAATNRSRSRSSSGKAKPLSTSSRSRTVHSHLSLSLSDLMDLHHD